MPTFLLIIIAVVAILGLLLMLAFNQYRRDFLATKTNEVIKDKVILKIAVPRNNDKSPFAAEQLYAALHGIGMNKDISKEHFSLEIAAGPYGIHFICVVSKEFKTFVENQIYSQYPEAQIGLIQDYTDTFAKNPGAIEIAELTLVKERYLPLRTFQSFDVDPLAGITGAVSSLPPGHEAFIQILARPVADTWQEAGKNYVQELRNKKDGEGNKVQLESGESEVIKLIENKNTKVGFQFLIRILAITPDKVSSDRVLNEVVASFGQYRTAVFNSLGKPKVVKKEGLAKTWDDLKTSWRQRFVGKRLSEKLSKKEKFIHRYLDEDTQAVINTEELASLYHIPNKSVETPNISWARSKKLEYPLNIPTQGSRILGVTDYRGVHIPFGINHKDRLRHTYIIGKTGVGKSTFMEGLIMADIYDGYGVGVIDPHGELINQILEMMPANRIEDVILFDPGDVEYPVGFNMLEIKEGEDMSLITDGIVSVFKKQWIDSWGPRLEYILTNTLLTLLNCQNVSLLVIPRMLSDDNYRVFILKQLKDPILLKFWNEEYAELARDKKRLAQEISSILNKIGRFTTNPMIRNIVGQVSSSIDIRHIMDNRKILLVNLAQGKVGEENMALLGGMLVSRIYSSATQRQDPTQREPFYLYIDEFQNFTTPTFVKILSEARKYGLSLNVAHQFVDQLEVNIRNAIVGNVGSMINFSVGPQDAEFLIKEYAPYLTPPDLVNLGKGEIVTKISIDMTQSKPFTAKTLLPNFPRTHMKEEVLKASRRKYAKHRDQIRKKLYKWAEQVYSKQGVIVPKEVLQKYAEQKEQMEAQAAAEGGQQYNNNPRPDFRRDDRPPRDNRSYGPRDQAPRGNDSRPPYNNGPRTDRAPRYQNNSPTGAPSNDRYPRRDERPPQHRGEQQTTGGERRSNDIRLPRRINDRVRPPQQGERNGGHQPNPAPTEPTPTNPTPAKPQVNLVSSDPLPKATEQIPPSQTSTESKPNWMPADPLPPANPTN